METVEQMRKMMPEIKGKVTYCERRCPSDFKEICGHYRLYKAHIEFIEALDSFEGTTPEGGYKNPLDD